MNFFQKNNVLNEDIGRKKCSVSVPEMKTIILLAYYVLFGLMFSIYTGRTIKETPLYIENIYAYLLCQLHGDNPACRKFQEQYLEHQSPNITSIIFIMMGLITWVNLLFVVQYQDIKWIAAKISNILCYFTRPTTEYTFANGSSTKSYPTNNTSQPTCNTHL